MSVTAQNSLDVLSKACENISEENETNGQEQLPFTEEDGYVANSETIQEEHYDIEEDENSANNGIESGFFEDYIGPEDECTGSLEDRSDQALRKSGRKRRPRPPSPDVTQKLSTNKRPRSNLYQKANRTKKVSEAPFKCDLCGSPNITDPTRRGNRPKTSTSSPSPRHKKDPETGKMLTLCNACGKFSI